MRLRRRIVEPVVLGGLLAQALLAPFATGLTPALAASRGAGGAAATTALPAHNGRRLQPRAAAPVTTTVATTATAPATGTDTSVVTDTAVATALPPQTSPMTPLTPTDTATSATGTVTSTDNTTPAPSDTTLPSPSATASPTGTTPLSAAALLLAAPLAFEANAGQTDASVAYLAHGPGYTLFVGAGAATLTLAPPPLRAAAASMPLTTTQDVSASVGLTGTAATTSTRGPALRLRYVGASAGAQVAGQDHLDGVINAYSGADPSGWHTAIATYGTLTDQGVYPGIDLVYYGNAGGRLETDWRISPGADPGAIALGIDGAAGLRVDAAGNLLIATGAGTVVQQAPHAYQQSGGVRHPIDVRYTVSGSTAGFALGAYDHSQPLVIDPVLDYSTYLGGSGADQGNAIAVDALGNTYLTGSTTSSNFPTKVGPYTSPSGLYDAFVTKLGPGGNALVYSTYLGSAGEDGGHAIAVDASGNAYVTGYTGASGFPTTSGAYRSGFQGGSHDAFVTKLSGNAHTPGTLLYSTYLGGSDDDQGYGIAVDASGNAYVTGYTYSGTTSPIPFPTLNAVQPTYGGGGLLGGDAFVTKLNAGGTQVLYSTYLGGSGGESGAAVAVDGAGNAYVDGYTTSGGFPTTAAAYDRTLSGTYDAFVSELNADDSALLYSTYLGGTGNDAATALALDWGGNVYVSGNTGSSLGFPLRNAVQTGYGGGTYDAFVSKLNTQVSGDAALVYSTFLGGSGTDVANGIAVDDAGQATVVGQTQSTDVLTTTNALQGQCADTGCSQGDAFVATIAAGGGALLYGTYLGGSGADKALAVAADWGGNLYATGATSSTDFLTTTVAYSGSAAGNNDTFITKLGVPSSGEIPWHPHHTVRLADNLSLSVDLADGHLDVSADDLSIPGRGPDLALRHTWDSTAAAAGLDTVAGQGWRTTLTPRLTGVVTQTMVFTDGTGAAWPFLYLGSPSDTSPYTTYRTPPGISWQLATSSAAYTLTNILSGEVLVFDTLGRLQSDRDSYGNQNSLSYDLFSVPKSITNSGGRTLQISDQNGKMADVQGPLWGSTAGAAGQHVAYGYNGSGQLTSLTWGAGTTDALTATFGYSGTQLVTVTTPYTQSPHAWSIGYDGQGRASYIVSPVSGTVGQTGYTPAYLTAFGYSAIQTFLFEGYGSSAPLSTTYTLDAAGDAIAVTDGLGHTSYSGYDADHDVTSSTDANLHTTTNYYQYVGPNASTGLVTETVAPAIAVDVPGNQTLTPVQTLHYYNATNDMTATVSPNGGLTLYGYDSHHGVITTTEQTNPTDCPGGCTSWRGTVNQLDQYGEVTGTVDGRGVDVTTGGVATLDPVTAPSYTRQMRYDAAGDQISSSTPPLTTTLNGITQTVPVTTAYGYDADGNQISVTQPNGTRPGRSIDVGAGTTTGTSYDHLGRAVQSVQPGVGLVSPVAGTGIITTVAGSGACCFSGDGGPATAAKLFAPYGVAEDGAGNLYVADQGNHRIREVFAASGRIATIAGTTSAGPAGDGGPAAQAQLNYPYDVALDAQGNLYIADSANNKVREILASTGIITTVVGTGTACSAPTASCGDGGAATAAQLNSPKGVVLDQAGNLYISDSNDHRIRRVDAQSGIISTVAGTGTACSPSTATCGDGGSATSAQLNAPRGIGLDAQANLYIADTGDNRVREVVAGSGVIVTVAGTGAPCAAATTPCGDGGAATSAQFYVPRAVAADASGNLYIADTGDNRVREVVASTGIITTVAGTGAACPSSAGDPCGDGGPATAATLNEPLGLAVDGANNVVISDYSTNRVRMVQGSGLRPAQRTAYDGEGNVVQQVDGNGDVTADSYDPMGRLVAETNPVSGTTVYTYNATEQTAVQDPMGYLNQMSYDAAGRLTQTTDPISGTQQFAYDAVGNTTVISSGDGVVVTQTETLGYDALDEPVTDTVSSAVAPSEPPSTTLTAYDLDGNVAQVQQPNGDVTYNRYDTADQLLSTEIDTGLLSPITATTHAAYDAYTYDAAGNTTIASDPSGTTTTSYDGSDRPVQTVDYTGTGTITSTPSYDPNGNELSRLRQTLNGNGPLQTSTYTATYNLADWTTATKDDGYGTTFGFDGAGRERTRTTGDPTSVSTTVDPGDRITAISESTNGAGPYTTQYGYNADDWPITQTLPNGVQQSAQYDHGGNLTGISTSGTHLSGTYSYGYNALGWTTSYATPYSGTDTITHDPATGRLQSESGPNVTTPSHTYTWSYDGNGNVTQSTADNGNPEVFSYTPGTTLNELLQTHATGYSQPDTYYGYDPYGNTTAITNPHGLSDPTNTDAINTRLVYDAQARPITVTKLSMGRPITVTLGYNAQGLRSRYTESMSGTVILDQHLQYQGGQVGQVVATTATLNQNGSVKSSGAYTDTYVYGPDGAPLEFIRARTAPTVTTDRYYYVLDGRGNVVDVTDSGGNVVDSYQYDLWGELLPDTAKQQVPQPLRYGGMWWDDDLEWYWADVRYYDPELMRWLQPDPLEIDGVQTYAYAADDPVDLRDVSGLGLDFVCQWGGFGQAVCSAGSHVVSFLGGALHVGYQVVLGNDLNTLFNDPKANGLQKVLAVVDIASNALVLVPVAGEVVEGARVAKVALQTAKALDEGRTLRQAGIITLREAKALLKQGAKRVLKDVGGACVAGQSFPAGTLVATPHGQTAIQTLHVGDTVLAENPATGTAEPEAVQAVIVDPVSPLIAVDLSDGSAITVTASHPVYVDRGLGLPQAGWLEAGQLRVGDYVRTADGKDVVVAGLRRGMGRALVYTLTVAKDHTFFVGSARVLVHNAIGPCGVRLVLRQGSHIGNPETDRGLEHIVYRHWWSGGENAGHFEPWVGARELRDLIYRTADNPADWHLSPQGNGLYILDRYIGKVGGRLLGVDSKGKPAEGLRIVADAAGDVISAYPIKMKPPINP